MAFWNPPQVLDLYPSPTASSCSGITQRDARCKQPIFSNSDRSKTVMILRDMAYTQPDLISLQTFEHLAYLTLCPRWHRRPGYDQTCEVAVRFKRLAQAHAVRAGVQSDATRDRYRLSGRRVELIEDLPLPTVPRRQPRLLPVPAMSPVTQHTPQTITSTSSFTRLSTRTSSHDLSEESSVPATRLRSQQLPTPPDLPSSGVNSSEERRTTRSQGAPPPESLSPPQSPPASSATPSGSVPVAHATSEPLISVPSTPDAGNLAAAPPSPPTVALEPVIVPQDTKNLLASVARKPPNDPCPVCYEPLTLDTSVYCRRQCGSNIHRSCFKEWLRHCTPGVLDINVLVTCVYCRAIWMWE